MINTLMTSDKFQEMFDSLTELAKQNFERDGHLSSVVIVISDSSDSIAIPLNMFPSKDIADQAIRETISNSEVPVYGLIFIMEAWVAKFDKNDHTMVQLQHGELEVHDLEEKEEMIVLTGETKEKYSTMTNIPIIKSNNNIILGNSEKNFDSMGGRFSNYF